MFAPLHVIHCSVFCAPVWTLDNVLCLPNALMLLLYRLQGSYQLLQDKEFIDELPG